MDYHLKKVMEKGWSYVKDSGDFIKKINNLDSLDGNAISVKADVLGLYPAIPPEVGLRALMKILDKRDGKTILMVWICPKKQLLRIWS